MADRKFSALASIREQSAQSQADAPASQVPAPEPSKGRGRPPGKRSNPDWKLYSHFLKKRTHREAAARIQAEDDGRDLSDVLQELLEKWLKT